MIDYRPYKGNMMHTFKPGSFGALPEKARQPNTIGDIWVSHKNLTSLEGCPELVTGKFILDSNSKLTSLIGGPKEVGGYYSADTCDLRSLEGLPIKINSELDIRYNESLTSLQGINQLKEMKGHVWISGCPIASHILGVFLIKGCSGISNDEFAFGKLGAALEIVNSHISKGRAGLIACIQELIEAGLDDFAQI
jgi:hypothetical protein